jgi:plasmid stability protein
MAAKREELILRLPSELKKWLEQEAARHCSSMNSEVVRAVRARMESEQARA